jgi:hypothetical protein
MVDCKLRKIQFQQSGGWQADCFCGFTSGEKSSFSAAMEEIEKHWNQFGEVAA